jgi:hypothetical protein
MVMATVPIALIIGHSATPLPPLEMLVVVVGIWGMVDVCTAK